MGSLIFIRRGRWLVGLGALLFTVFYSHVRSRFYNDEGAMSSGKGRWLMVVGEDTGLWWETTVAGGGGLVGEDRGWW
ncbi:hypothetical protein ACFX2I_006242 [Malus domestica]